MSGKHELKEKEEETDVQEEIRTERNEINGEQSAKSQRAYKDSKNGLIYT